jgi:thioredoxin reductase (NADPH)
MNTAVESMSYDPATGLHTLNLSDGSTVEARSVVIAGGVQFRDLGFPGSDSPNVITGDGKALQAATGNGSSVIIGGSNGAAQAALGVAQTASHVTLLSRSPIEKGMSAYQVDAVRNHPKITVVEGDQIKSCGTGGVTPPSTSYVPEAIKAPSGKIATNGVSTSMPGVFAVGDVREGSIPRIGVAVGDGQMAIAGVHGHLASQAQAAQETQAQAVQ